MPKLVGRDRELRELEDALGAAIGRGELVLVSGEAGVGKSRLCDEMARSAAARDVTVAWSRCWEAEAVPPFWPWEQVVNQLTGGDLPGLPDSGGGDPEIARIRLFEEIAAAIAGEASGRPLLVVDDVQWADVASVRLLSFLVPRLRHLPVLALATCRELEAQPGTPTGDAIVELGRHCRHLRLAGLDVGDIPALIGPLSGGTTEGIAAAVHHHTGGKPLFAKELVRLLKAQGSLGGLAATGAVPAVPATVKGVLARRLERLSPDCRRMAEVSAAVGDELGLDLVDAVTGMGRDRILDLVDEALRADVLRPTGLHRYAFTHPLVRATLLDDLGVARRVRLHERVGEALEGLRAGGHAVDLSALAYHFLEAAPASRGASAARYAVEAAEEAMGRLAYENAVLLYRQALAALELDPAGGDRCEMLLGLGTAQLATGDLPGARATYLAAASAARAGNRADQLARSALGVGGGGGFEVALGDREQLDLLEEARRALDDDQWKLRALVTARLSVALSLSTSQARRLALSEEALETARAIGDPATIAYALSAHCDAIAGPADTERRLAESTEIVELGAAGGDFATELLGRRLRLVALLELGDVLRADAEIEAYARLANLVRQPIYAWYVSLWGGCAPSCAGSWPSPSAWPTRLRPRAPPPTATTPTSSARRCAGTYAAKRGGRTRPCRPSRPWGTSRRSSGCSSGSSPL